MRKRTEIASLGVAMSSPAGGALAALLSLVETAGLQPRRSGAEWVCLCPCHGDRHPSFGFREGNKGRGAVGVCRACNATLPQLLAKIGASREAVDAILGAQGPASAAGSNRSTVATYLYEDPATGTTYRKRRVSTAAGKIFVWEHREGVGTWRVGRGGGPAMLYQVAAVREALASGAPIAITEGEKCAEWVTAAGIVATTNPDGAGKWKPEFTEQLRSASRVLIFADNDSPGLKHAEHVLKQLRAVGVPSLALVTFPELPEKGDVADFLAAIPEAERAARLAERIEQAGEALGFPEGKTSPPDYNLRRFSEIADVNTEWLWPGYIAFGVITLLDGDPGLGKSTLALDLAARLSRGDAMPFESEGRPPVGSIIISTEDDHSRVIRPRLVAAGANLDLIHTLTVNSEGDEREPTISAGDLVHLSAAVRESGARLLILDPLVALLPTGTDANKDQDVRKALGALRRFVEAEGVACVCLRHLRKSGGDRSIYRGGGSIGIVGAARAALLVDKDPDSPDGSGRVLAVLKNNLAPLAQSLGFRLEASAPTEPARIAWSGPSHHGADSLLQANDSPEERTRVSEAREWLTEELSSGPVAEKKLREEAHALNISRRTLDRAKKDLGIPSLKFGAPGAPEQGWEWALPGEGCQPAPKNAKPESGNLRQSWQPSDLSEKEADRADLPF